MSLRALFGRPYLCVREGNGIVTFFVEFFFRESAPDHGTPQPYWQGGRRRGVPFVSGRARRGEGELDASRADADEARRA